ncbi:hypothetical protein F5148DRAFT_1245273 [Russula earlei]|uniref:Uncharacterized protein n=1 Tax=Russula earlei TaxID=71964 RepID=A0ACC0TUT0_9AGAM|nr:hypothetical protein F5148DRAFT_1245273 [Russula earlei]
MPLASLYINFLATPWTQAIEDSLFCCSHQSACKSQEANNCARGACSPLFFSVRTRPPIKPTEPRVPRPGALQTGCPSEALIRVDLNPPPVPMDFPHLSCLGQPVLRASTPSSFDAVAALANHAKRR